MTTAIIGTGGIGSVIARQLASGGETLRLSSADTESARTLAAEIGRAAVVAAGNRDALQGADAVVLALRFTVLKGVIDEIADPLTGKLVVVPSNPLTTDAQGNQEAEAYRRDVPDAEVHVLDAGHFALDEQPDLIANLTRRFLQRRQAHTDG